MRFSRLSPKHKELFAWWIKSERIRIEKPQGLAPVGQRDGGKKSNAGRVSDNDKCWEVRGVETKVAMGTDWYDVL